MLFPLPGNCTLRPSSGTITKLKDNFKDQGKKVSTQGHKLESGRDLATNDHKWDLSTNNIYDQQTPLRN